MDPLSTSASIIAIFQLTSDVVKYINGASGAARDRRRLLDEIHSCELVLFNIKCAIESGDDGGQWLHKVAALGGSESPLERLTVALEATKSRLMPKRGINKILASLTWPFDEKEVMQLVSAIQREKSLLQLVLTSDCREVLLELQRHAAGNLTLLNEIASEIRNKSHQEREGFKQLKRSLGSISLSAEYVKGGIDDLRHHQSYLEQGKILEWLSPLDFTAQQSDFLSRRQKGTANWFLESTEFNNWLGGDYSKTLFCPGLPGAGKTILTSVVVDHLTKLRTSNVGLANIYVHFQRKEDQTVEKLIGSLLKQLVHGRGVPDYLQALYSQHVAFRTRPSLDELLATLDAIVLSYSTTFIVVDALDELQTYEGTRSRFIDALFVLQSKASVKVLTTSRFLPDIIERFASAHNLEIRATERDVGIYLESRMSQLPAFVRRNEELQSDIKTGIIQAFNGMFLLAHLHVCSLEGSRAPKAVRQLLERLPAGSGAYDKLYRDCMERISLQNKNQKDLACQVISWITFSRRPLKVDELRHALAIELDEVEEYLDTDNMPCIEDMVSVCAGLVTVDEQVGIVRLVHYTAQEYFERTAGEWFPSAEVGMGMSCVAYLSFRAFDGYCRTDRKLEDRLLEHPLYDYAAKHWGHHCQQAMSLPERDRILNFLRDQNYLPASCQVLALQSYPGKDFGGYSQLFPKNVSGLHLAAFFGLSEAASILQSEMFVGQKDSDGKTPLAWAVAGGRTSLVSQLLDVDQVEIETTDSSGQTALSHAARAGYTEIAQLLLEKGAVVDSIDIHRRTPLSRAASGGHLSIVELLIRNHADVEFEDNQGRSPLSWASGRGWTNVARALLENGARIESKDSSTKRTPLLWAAKCHQPIVELLLQHGANIEAQDKYGRTILSLAAVRNNMGLANLLISHGAKIDALDYESQTPLLCATMEGHEEMARLLLSNGASVHVCDDQHRTPLSWAAHNGLESLVTLYVDQGAQIDMQDVTGRTPLSWAANNGYEEVSNLLFDMGAAIESRDTYGRTPLWWACLRGQIGVVVLLVQRGAEVDPLDSDQCGTPLSAAATAGHTAIAELLLDNGADISGRNGRAHKPLCLAAEAGHLAVVEAMLERSADANVKGGKQDLTPLSYAAANGHVDVARKLLSYNADINSKDRDGRTPILHAAFRGHELMVSLLLASGADIEEDEIPAQNSSSSNSGGASQSGGAYLYRTEYHYTENDKTYTDKEKSTCPGKRPSGQFDVEGYELGEYEALDPRFRREPSYKFQLGEVFKVLWPEPSGKLVGGTPSISDRQRITNNKYGEDLYIGFRRFIVVENDQGHCRCVPILTYGGKGCNRSGTKAEKHGIIYDARGKARLLSSEPRLGFPSIRLVIEAEGESLAKASRVNYSKIVTVEHYVNVFFIGHIRPDDLPIVSDAVNACWEPRVRSRRKISDI